MGIEPDNSKVEKILNWPRPWSTTDIHHFLGLVHYLAAFLPNLATHTSILTPLTTAQVTCSFPAWESHHQFAFEAIKSIVVSHDCLTMIDHSDMEQRIFLMTDSSDLHSDAVLSFGKTWETA